MRKVSPGEEIISPTSLVVDLHPSKAPKLLFFDSCGLSKSLSHLIYHLRTIIPPHSTARRLHALHHIRFHRRHVILVMPAIPRPCNQPPTAPALFNEAIQQAIVNQTHNTSNPTCLCCLHTTALKSATGVCGEINPHMAPPQQPFVV